MPTSNVRRPVMFYLDETQVAYLDEVANREKKSRAEVVRQLIDQERVPA